jgi:hypothetical protein
MITASHTPNPGDFIKNEFGARAIINYSKVEILNDYSSYKKNLRENQTNEGREKHVKTEPQARKMKFIPARAMKTYGTM